MSLPPVTVHIKRKATDEPVDYLRWFLYVQLHTPMLIADLQRFIMVNPVGRGRNWQHPQTTSSPANQPTIPMALPPAPSSLNPSVESSNYIDLPAHRHSAHLHNRPVKRIKRIQTLPVRMLDHLQHHQLPHLQILLSIRLIPLGDFICQEARRR